MDENKDGQHENQDRTLSVKRRLANRKKKQGKYGGKKFDV